MNFIFSQIEIYTIFFKEINWPCPNNLWVLHSDPAGDQSNLNMEFHMYLLYC